MPIKSHVHTARKYVYNAAAVADNVMETFVRNVNMIRFTSGESVEKTKDTKGDVGQ